MLSNLELNITLHLEPTHLSIQMPRIIQSQNCPSVRAETFQQTRGRREEGRSRQRFRKVEQAIVQSRRIPNKHPLQHFLDDPQSPRVPDEICSELAGTRGAKRHVITKDVMLVTILIFDRGKRLMRLLLARFRIIKLDIVQLGATNNCLLLLSLESTPRFEVVDVLLHDN